MQVSALVMAGGTTVMLLHADARFSDEGVRHFLSDVAELYVKVLIHALNVYFFSLNYPKL
jgi:hypothetical protein